MRFDGNVWSIVFPSRNKCVVINNSNGVTWATSNPERAGVIRSHIESAEHEQWWRSKPESWLLDELDVIARQQLRP